MELNEFKAMISFAKTCKYSSLNYTDYEDVKESEVIRNDPSLLLLYEKSNDLSEIQFAANDLQELLESIDVHNLKGLIKFIPFDAIAQFERHDFEVHCAYQDYSLKDLRQVKSIPDTNYEIRFASIEDAKELSDISLACKGQSRGFIGETKEWFIDWFEENEIIVKRSNGKIAGFCCVSIYAEGTTLWIREIAVHPEFQSNGIGRELMNMAIQYGRSNGAQKSFLAVDLENKNAIRLYEFLGYEAKAGEIEVQMLKK